MTHQILDSMALGAGKLTRLRRMLFNHGPENGKLLILPYDQGLEHGPRDFFDNYESLDPNYILDLAVEGKFSAVVLHQGVAEKYYHRYAGKIPLVLKLNGKTDVPSEAQALSPIVSSVEEAVALGADGVGYTVYVGSPMQTADLNALMKVRQDAARLGMPLFIWAYPRGEAIDKMGGRECFYSVDYAARCALELGADVAIINYPTNSPEDRYHSKKPYQSMEWDPAKCLVHAIKAAGNTLVVVTGGGRMDDPVLLAKAEHSLDAGASGLIIGRNVWQRSKVNALEIINKIHVLLKK
ncbi:MAG: fructose-bisphosphate aldolase [Firmicutes bacterium]|nr:fructose-bisphosphate aldolase [Bacillota bacterium]